MKNYKINKETFENKNVLILGDSVSAQATIGEGNKTYSTLLSEAFNFKSLRNEAIGGTTLTYMFEGSAIDKEYHDHQVAIDGCRVVTRLANEDALKNIDIAFIAYGHNDQYFQVPTDEKDNKNINSLAQCHSFSNSYRYIINTLLKANKDMIIILLNCTYSEYDKTYKTPYFAGYTYLDYRNATKNIAKEYDLKEIDPWDYMKQFIDYNTNKYYYQDSVHLSPKGHIELYNFLLNK